MPYPVRKIIQIATASMSTPATEPTGQNILYALCDDGSVWYLQSSNRSTTGWRKDTDIPQD